MRLQFQRGVNVHFVRLPVYTNGKLGAPRQFLFLFQLNWVLILKHIVLFYVLGHDSGMKQMYLLIGGAVSIYMWEIRYIQFVHLIFDNALPNPRRLL